VTLSERDRRALMILGAAVVIALLYWAFSRSSSPASTKIAAPADTVEHAEKRLAAVRASAATLSGKEAVLKQVSSELAEREKGLIQADTAAQAQAQLLQIVRRIASAQIPPLEVRQVELGQARQFTDAYGQVTVSVTLDTRIDGIINFLAALSAQPELIATDEIRFGSSIPKQKNMPVRVTVSAIVPKRLAPEKKGVAAF
jgi:hypothetical protein